MKKDEKENDVVIKINAYNLKHNTTSDFILTKKGKTKTHEVSFIVIPSNIEEIKEIKLTKEVSQRIVDLLKKNKLINHSDDVQILIYGGVLSNFKGYENIVKQYPYRNIDRREKKDPQYRLYTTSAEEQEKIRYSLNICRSAELSWQSVIKKCGTEYGIIFKLNKEL